MARNTHIALKISAPAPIPAVAATTHNNEEDDVATTATTVTVLLKKPITRAMLTKRICPLLVRSPRLDFLPVGLPLFFLAGPKST